MPKMDWENFQRDHHRPHLLVVTVEPETAPRFSLVPAEVEQLAVRLGAVGNYAVKAEDTTIYAAFEENSDAMRLSEVFRPKQIIRDSEWASMASAKMDAGTFRRIAAILNGTGGLTTKRRKLSTR